MNTSVASHDHTNHRSSPRIISSRHAMTEKILLSCGIASSVYYILMNTIVPLFYDGYNAVTQTVSELSAVNAPTRTLWVAMGIGYTLLVLAFARGVWLSTMPGKGVKVVASLLFVFAITGLVCPPMHTRGNEGNWSDIMHIVCSVMLIALMMLSIIFASRLFGKAFRIYSITTLLLFLLFGTLTGLEAPNIVTNGPTPFIGVWERINIGVFMIWLVVFSLLLLRVENRHARVSETSIHKDEGLAPRRLAS